MAPPNPKSAPAALAPPMIRASVRRVHVSARSGFVLLFFTLAVASAACGPTCPDGQQSCGTPATGSAGSAGATSSSSECAALTSLRACLDAFCATADNPTCSCYKRSGPASQLNTGTCRCEAFDAQTFCAQATVNGITSYDCQLTAAALATACIPVGN